MDYRLAVLFAVAIPLVLLIWAFVVRADAVLRLSIVYWRVASLLAITTYMMIAAIPASFVAALGARFLIPISLWFWVDLNEELDEQPQARLRFAFRAWRWAMTVYFTLGAIVQVSTLSCAVATRDDLVATPWCRAWLEPTWLYKDYFHANTSPGFLGFLGVVGLIVYVLCLGYFVLFRLGKQGRTAIVDR